MTKRLPTRLLPHHESSKLLPMLLLVAVATHFLFFYLGDALLGDTWINFDPTYMGRKFLTHKPSAGITIFMMGSLAGPLSLGYTLQALALQKHIQGKIRALMWCTLIAACSVGMCIICFARYIDASKTFAEEVPDNLYEFMGSLTFSAYVPMTIACVWMIIRLAKSKDYKMIPKLATSKLEGSAAGMAIPQAPTSFGNYSFQSRWKGIFFGFIALTLCFFFSCILAPHWVYNAGLYFRLKADPYYTLLDPSTTLPLPSFLKNWNPPPGFLQPIIYVKLPPYVAIYYGVLGSLFLLGILGTSVPKVRRFLQQRMKFPALWNNYQPFPLGISRGEFFVLFASMSLMAYWGIYWGLVDKNIQKQPAEQNDTHHPKLNIVGRASGHLCSLSMALALLPVSRNSIWDAAWGVPFEKAVRYHRIVGRLAWLFATVHMITWHIKWASEGLYWKSVFQADQLVISPCPETGCIDWVDGRPNILPQYHIDNFTIPLSQFAWLLFTAAIVIAQCFRRSRYQLFRITHAAAIFFCIVGFLHAHIYWHYSVIGLSLWAFDRVIRYVNSSRDLPFVSLESVGEVTRLVLQVNPCNKNFSSFSAGQYAWICVPDISPFDWHPFTISSAPSNTLTNVSGEVESEDPVAARQVGKALASGSAFSSNPAIDRHLAHLQISKKSGYITFHIRDQGPGTWTNKLRTLALQLEAKQKSLSRANDVHALTGSNAATTPRLDLCVAMEGPYGRIGDLSSYETVVLVAGGIGITPFHSVLIELHARRRDSSKYGKFPEKLRKVVLVWCYRGEELLRNFASSLKVVMEDDFDGLFEVHLYNTSDATNLIISNDSTEWSSQYCDEIPVEDIRKPLLDVEAAITDTLDNMDPLSADELSYVSLRSKKGRPDLKFLVGTILDPRLSDANHYSAQSPIFPSDSDGMSSSNALSSTSSDPKNPDNFTKICILACGPQSLLVEASETAFAYSASFHNEEFFF